MVEHTPGAPTPSAAWFPPPDTPAVGILRPPEVPTLPVDGLGAPVLPVATTGEGDLDALAALIALEPADSAPLRPIDLPTDVRSALLQLLETRHDLWARLDALAPEAEKFRRLIARAAPRGQAVPTFGLVAAGGDPEHRAHAIGAAADTLWSELRAANAELDALDRQRTTKRTPFGAKRLRHEAGLRRQSLDRRRRELRGLLEEGIDAVETAMTSIGELLTANARTITEVEQNVATPEHAPWEMARWVGWNPPDRRSAGDLRLGTLIETRSGETLSVPLVTPLIGSNRALVITSSGADEHEAALELLQSLVVRAAAALPQQVRFTLLDPATNGLAFPMARHLSDVTPASFDLRRQLEETLTHVRRIVTTYLDASTTSFDDLPEETRLGESYEFVVAADFPNGYDERSAELLEQLARTGPRAGVYVIVHLNHDRIQTAPEFARFGFDGAHLVDIGDEQISIGAAQGTVAFDRAPAAVIQEAVLQRIADLPPRDRAIPWDELNRGREAQWWLETSEQQVRAPIGRHGAGQLLEVWLGTDVRQLRTCVHGVLGAMPGAGKSTLLHNVICSLSIRYSPDELQLYLIDGKYGVEFRPYRALPHAAVVSLRTAPALARSVLADLVAEMARRNGVFAEQGVVDLASYRALGQPAGTMPRIVLVIDEYQQLFEGDRDGAGSTALLRLSQQGRSAGIHFLLASQRFETDAMRNRNEIFGNVHLRMAMQLTQADIASLADFGTTGRRMIAARCDRAGRVVINERGGDDTANVAGKAALLTAERRDEIVSALARKAAQTYPSAPRPIVLDGRLAPSFEDNPHVQWLLARDAWPSEEQLAEWAAASVFDGGLGEPDWSPAELPVPLFAGHDFDVRRQATLVLRRRQGENLLLVGEREAPRVGVLATAVTSAALARDPHRLAIWLPDIGEGRGTPPATLIHAVRTAAMLGAEVRTSAAAPGAHTGGPSLIDDALTLVGRRREMSAEQLAGEATVLLIIHEPSAGEGNPAGESGPGEALQRLLATGPAAGVHVLVSAGTLNDVRRMVPDRALEAYVRHRVVLNVTEADSFVLVRSTAAARLDRDGELTATAVRYDANLQRVVPFQPYTTGTDDAAGESLKLSEQLAAVGERLADRR